MLLNPTHFAYIFSLMGVHFAWNKLESGRKKLIYIDMKNPSHLRID